MAKFRLKNLPNPHEPGNLQCGYKWVHRLAQGYDIDIEAKEVRKNVKLRLRKTITW